MRQRGTWLTAALIVMLVISPVATPAPAPAKRIAFIIDRWYRCRWSHADVIGTRFMDGYRVGDTVHPAALSVVSVYADAPSSRDQTRAMAARYGFRIASSIADALLEDHQSARLRFAADGVLVTTQEDIPGSGQRQSPARRLQVMQEIFRIMNLAGAHVPIFVDKMLSASWPDSQAIVTEAARRRIPLMAGSVLPFFQSTSH